MFNLFWGVLFMLVHFGLFLLCFRMFGKKGLYAWIGFATVIANIQVTKTIEMSIGTLAIVMTLGNTIYTSIYMTTDLLNERYGQQAAKRAVWFGFFTLIASTILMQMTLAFVPQAEDFAHEPLTAIFGFLPQVAAGSMCAYFVSQFLDVRVFSYLKEKFPVRNQFWIRINGSSLVSQFVDSLVFCTIAFYKVHSFDIWIQIFLTTYLLKLLISFLATPVLYWARNMKVQED
ncbi:queuosine precursor transporter [Paenibacillus sp. GCM10027627]|uniref:queuosine precursor transporter n=1 Tax=unclassified Paenibacillus TaxID=185978 RepID=UPI00363E6EB9